MGRLTPYAAPDGAADRASMCDGKDRLTFEQADHIARRMTYKGRPARAFKCRFCEAWHVGQPPVMGGRK